MVFWYRLVKSLVRRRRSLICSNKYDRRMRLSCRFIWIQRRIPAIEGWASNTKMRVVRLTCWPRRVVVVKIRPGKFRTLTVYTNKLSMILAKCTAWDTNRRAGGAAGGGAGGGGRAAAG